MGCSNVMDLKIEDIANRMTIKLCSIPGLSTEDIVNALVEIKSNIFSGYLKKDELIMISNSLAKKVSRSAESAEKSAENKLSLSKRQMQILSEMKVDNEYSADEIALLVKLKGPRTRQLLKELISIGEIEAIGTTKGRRYVKVSKKESSIL